MQEGKTIIIVGDDSLPALRKRLETNTKTRLAVEFARIIKLAQEGDLATNKELWQIIHRAL